eukprot:52297-Eustigmatos_ZCMA.PRE.1
MLAHRNPTIAPSLCHSAEQVYHTPRLSSKARRPCIRGTTDRKVHEPSCRAQPLQGAAELQNQPCQHPGLWPPRMAQHVIPLSKVA